MDLVVHSPEELLAAVPHVLGFKPEESVVLVPFRSGLPVARIDLPRTAADREGVWDALRGPYGRHARPGAGLAIVCITEDSRSAELVSQHLSSRLQDVGITTHIRLWSDGERWREFNTGQTGLQSPSTAERIAAVTVYTGAAQPAASRESLGASMVGDREPIALLLPAARAAAAAKTPEADMEWALERLEQFHDDGVRLSDIEGARMLVALETISTRDALWEDMSRENSAVHMALWTDLTRRGPDEVRAAPASMLGFASWLHGDGAKAWCALDQVPAGRPYSMALIVESVVQSGIHPREWDRYQSQMCDLAAELDESFVPRSPGQQRDIPGKDTVTDRPTPGR
ncbi:DUF4192 domain-containing protein [Nocardioides pacificus]